MGVLGGGGLNLHRKELIALPREAAILLLLLLAIAFPFTELPRALEFLLRRCPLLCYYYRRRL